jgi:hypothetical protein
LRVLRQPLLAQPVAARRTRGPVQLELAARPRLNIPRYKHTATLLPDGRVVVIGGHSGAFRLNSVEIFDPDTDSWRLLPTGSAADRHNHTAILLADGKILIIGGDANFQNALAFIPGRAYIMLVDAFEFTETLRNQGNDPGLDSDTAGGSMGISTICADPGRTCRAVASVPFQVTCSRPPSTCCNRPPSP